MSLLRSIQKIDSPLSARELFLAADYDSVVLRLDRARTTEDDELLVQTFVRMQKFDDAVRILDQSPIADTASGISLRAAIETRRGQYDAAEALLNAVVPVTDHQRDRVRFEKAMLAFCRLDTNTCAELLERPIPSMRQQADELMGWVLIRRCYYREAVAKLLEAADGPDKFTTYIALSSASFIAREMYLPDVMERIEALAMKEPPRYLAQCQVHIMRASAWFLALDGKFAESLRRFREAARFTTSDPWAISVLSDRGYVSMCFGELSNGFDDVLEALAFARETNWAKSQGEERRVLLMLAATLADKRPEDAKWCLDTYFSLKPTDGLSEWSRDVRSKAFENYALGCIARSDNRHEDAHKFFGNAFSIFRRIGYHWRAVLTLLARRPSIYVDISAAQQEYIESVLKQYPNSWLRSLLETQTKAHFSPPEFSLLTPTEQKVLDLLLAGKKNKDIAKQLGRKESTVAEHVTHILKKLDCSSRNELLSRYAMVQYAQHPLSFSV